MPGAAEDVGADGRLVAAQLGRVPRTPWRVAVRCRFGRPQVIASPSRLDTGEPFPTVFWLTCPHLAEAASIEESAGGVAAWARRIAADPALADEVRASDAAYQSARAAESAGDDACATVGIAGQADPLATKCLHAHVAAFLGGTGDPVGRAVVERAGAACADDRCGIIEPVRQGDGAARESGGREDEDGE